MLLQIISQASSEIPEIQDVETPTLVVPIANLTATSVYWFRAYPTSMLPNMTWTTDYFFLWSTDHDAGDGGVWWGRGNNLDCSDFEEASATPIIDGYQAETPKPYYFAGETRPTYLYYHTIGTNPINSPSIQQTNLITTASGELHSATWTQESNPLGNQVGDAHTGYLNFWEQDNGDLKGTHFKVGSSLPTLPTYQYSVLASDGLSATRGDTFDGTDLMPSGFYWSPSFGEFFKLYDKWWWLGTLNSTTTGGAGAVLAIYEANPDFTLKRLISVLNGGTTGRTWAIYPDLDGKVAHCYQNNKTVGVYYTTFNLAQLQFQ